MHPPVRLVAIDMDGTLLPTFSQVISGRNTRALKAVQQAGITLAIATGRRTAYTAPLLDGLGLSRNRRGVLSCGSDWQTTAPGVFVCGDAHRGASLVVWAIAEGRSVAHSVDAFLTGASDLPTPVHPTALPLAVV